MKKFFIATSLAFVIGLIAACGLSATTNPGPVAAQAVEVATATPTNTPVTTASRPATQPAPAVEPGIPAVVDELYLGVPAGNGHRPRRLALDMQQQRLYTFNEGLFDRPGGNTVSVIDLQTAQMTRLIRLNNRQNGDSLPTPIDLQVDPYRPRLYAVWGDPYGSAAAASLTIIDTRRLAIIQTLPGVEAVAPGPDRLYLANQSRLWAVDPDSLAELDARALDPRSFNRALRLNSQANRLYLSRGQPWSLEVFAAGALAPIGSYSTNNEILQTIIDATGGRLLLVEKAGVQAVLRTLDRDGQPLADQPPAPLAENIYGDLPLALTGQTLYVVDQDPGTFTYRLQALARPTLRPLDSLPLPTLPNDLIINPQTGRLYAAYSSPGSFLLRLDPASGALDTIFTALEIVDVLAAPAANRLYLLDDAAALQILNLSGYREIARVETGLDMTDHTNRSLAGLSLDPGRRRLYLSGKPVRTIDADSLKVTTYPGLVGQITPDPTGDRLYLTPPCQCRQEQCNTLILNADTLTGSQTLFPPEDPFTAPCVYATRLDAQNQLLYTLISNGVAGSNSGSYFAVFDTRPATAPRQIYTNTAISYGQVAFDPARRRAFLPRYRQDRSFIQRFEARGQTITPTLQLGGAQGQLAYDPQFDRLYAVDSTTVQVFDGDLTLLAETRLPGQFELLDFDSQNQRLYLRGNDARLLVVATGGGRLELPPPPSPAEQPSQQQQLFIAPGDIRFRLDGWQLYRSIDRGQSWQRLGRGLPARPANDLAISPNYAADQTLLAGLWNFGRGGGLYRSNDGGDTWQPVTRGLTDLEIQQIAFSPTFSRDRTIFVSALHDGLFRSSDGGDTWHSLADSYAVDQTDRKVSHVAVSPTFAGDGLIFIGYRELLRSEDGGDTWTSTGLPPGRVAFSPGFASDGLILSEGRWRSTDRGHNWQPAATGLEPAPFGVNRFLFSPNFTRDQTVYILFQAGVGLPLTLQRSVDAGRSWQSLLGGLPAGFELAAAAVLPGGELFLRAVDGQQLTLAPNRLDWGRRPVDIAQLDLHDLAIAPDGAIFVANSAAGVFKSTDGGRTWADTGFPARAPATQLARLAIAGNGTLFAAAGPALERTTDGGQSWTYLSDVPAGFTVASLAVSPDFSNDGTLIAGGDFSQNRLIRSVDGGDTWTVVFDGGSVEAASDISLVAFSPNFATDGTVYAWLQEGGLLRSRDRGRTWSLVFDQHKEQVHYFGQSLAVAPPGNRLYLGALDGRLLASTDGGQTWRDLGNNIPDHRIWSSALALADDGTIFLGTDIGVYRSSNAGQSWSRASAGLNSPPSVRALRFSQGRLYAALTGGGLFLSEDQGQSWRSPLAGPPASPVQPPPAPGPSPAGCANPPTYFSQVWAGRVAQLGCPGSAQRLTMVEQTFEGGRMFWRSDLAVIYALPAAAPYAQFEDTWDESQPAYTCPELGPPQTPPTPQRGFGKVWCNEAQIRRLLGPATGSERPFEATLQEFETGLIFQTDQGAIYLLENKSNRWQQVE